MEDIPESGMDTLRERINIGIGRAAGNLNELTRARVIPEVPIVELIRREELSHHAASFNGSQTSAVTIDVDGYIMMLLESSSPENILSKIAEMGDNNS